jgi:hypothetical protein
MALKETKAIIEGEPIREPREERDTKKLGRKELIDERMKIILHKAHAIMERYDVLPVRWLNRKVVCYDLMGRLV